MTVTRTMELTEDTAAVHSVDIVKQLDSEALTLPSTVTTIPLPQPLTSSFSCPPAEVCPSLPAAHKSLQSQARPQHARSQSLTLSMSPPSRAQSGFPSLRRPHLNARARRVCIKECKQLRRQIRSHNPALPSHSQSLVMQALVHSHGSAFAPPSQQATVHRLQEQYSRKKSLIRESAATSIQAVWRGYRVRKAMKAMNMKTSTYPHTTTTRDGGASDAADPSLSLSEIDVAQTPQHRFDAMIASLVYHRETDPSLARPLEEWSLPSLEREHALLRILLNKENYHRMLCKSYLNSATSVNDFFRLQLQQQEEDTRVLFSPLYSHFKYLVTLVKQRQTQAKSLLPNTRSNSGIGSETVKGVVSDAPHLSALASSSPSPSPQVLHSEKRALQLRLSDYTRSFQLVHGRTITSADDIAPVKEEWARYKMLKYLLSDNQQSSQLKDASSNIDSVINETIRQRRGIKEVQFHQYNNNSKFAMMNNATAEPLSVMQGISLGQRAAMSVSGSMTSTSHQSLINMSQAAMGIKGSFNQLPAQPSLAQSYSMASQSFVGWGQHVPSLPSMMSAMPITPAISLGQSPIRAYQHAVPHTAAWC